ncbi:hypothetical protein [Pseudanabaena mucicola]|uniref:hypothetical protein n=1 Tax=Pseudanabaena mucicola TaxID=71190 RepID=UPI001F549FB6|nr:hypothetical protein [Pseudanabaena mucicola]
MIIIDTGAFVALFNRRDSAHLAAQKAFETIQEPMITTFPVILLLPSRNSQPHRPIEFS